MNYDYPLYRPPSEAYSLILQVTIGCSHNACTFCTMYKQKRFRQKDWPEISELINTVSQEYPHTKRIFLADGNALALPTETLVKTLKLLYVKFPSLERVSIYGGPKDILGKTPAELETLYQEGLGLVYLGIESGSEQVLKLVHKGASPQEMVEAGQKVKKSGLKLSATIISGLGGRELWEEHALETARVVSEINPHYLASLTLLLEEGAPLLRKIKEGKFTFLTPWETLKELHLFMQHVDLDNCVYRANHVSNYFSLAGVLNQERNLILQKLEYYLSRANIKALPVDYNRML